MMLDRKVLLDLINDLEISTGTMLLELDKSHVYPLSFWGRGTDGSACVNFVGGPGRRSWLAKSVYGDIVAKLFTDKESHWIDFY